MDKLSGLLFWLLKWHLRKWGCQVRLMTWGIVTESECHRQNPSVLMCNLCKLLLLWRKQAIHSINIDNCPEAFDWEQGKHLISGLLHIPSCPLKQSQKAWIDKGKCACICAVFHPHLLCVFKWRYMKTHPFQIKERYILLTSTLPEAVGS